ncbi:hypothetical protein [Buttiauxella sp. B2]|uniref:hypothetical protein n=1 Tax=Buttiauxella sp. B2 TaxID=2587812 RepID=UPI001CB8C2F1|nr:hypothetical protein [Buttiauxella sp. B2]
MTVSTEVDHNDYTGNGITTVFPYHFRIFKQSDLIVVTADLDDNQNELILGTDFTVTEAGSYQGGNIILVSPLSIDWKISLSRVLPVTQETDLRNQGKFFAEVHETAFDKLTMLIQQVGTMFGLALRKPSSIANWYDALNNYIRNVRDPRDPQDAATKNYVDMLAGNNFNRTLRVPESIPQLPDATTRANKIIAFDGQGNPFVVLPPSGSASDVLIELAKPTGSGLVGYGSETVHTALTRHDTDFSRIISLDERTEVPPFGYSGNKHWMPIFEDGHQLRNYIFKTPTHVDFQFSSDPLNVTSGPVFTFGRDDQSGSSPFWSQDSYELKNGIFDGGSAEIAIFEPWTSHTAVVENNRILNNGSPSKYAINFKAQNWWPIVRGNTFADYLDKGGNFCSCVDDGGVEADKYTGNSRLVFSQNRCKWLGAGQGGIMLYTSGVHAAIHDNASENGFIAVKFGWPSSYANIHTLYNELTQGGQVVIQIGDDVARLGSNVYNGIVIQNVYSNFHGRNTNKFITVGNSEVLLNEIRVDELFISNIPTTGFIQPLIAVNDIAYQKIIVGRVIAPNASLLPLTTNYVSVTDMYSQDIPALNSDLVYMDNSLVNVPANSSTAVAPGWYVKSTSAAVFNRTGSGSPRGDLRNARYVGSLSAIANAQSSFYFEFPRADLVNYEYVTIQFLINTSVFTTNVVKTSIYNPDSTRIQLDLRTIDSGPSWQEFTITVSTQFANSSQSFITVEIGNSSVSAMTTYITAFRMNRGQFGLCYKANGKSYEQTVREKNDYTYITP